MEDLKSEGHLEKITQPLKMEWNIISFLGQSAYFQSVSLEVKPTIKNIIP